MRPRWRKVVGDLRLYRGRSLLAMLALLIGVFAVGADFSGYAVLTREMAASFRGTTPPSFVVQVEGRGAEPDVVRAVAQLPGIRSAEPRGVFEGRVLVGAHDWRRMLLFVVDDFNRLRVSKLTREQGAWPPASGEVLLERSAVPFVQLGLGETLQLRLPAGPLASLKVAGIVHDAAQSPGWMDGIGYGYMTAATLEQLTTGAAFNQLHVLAEPGQDMPKLMADVRRAVEARGLPVSFIDSRKGSHHPHADQMRSLLFLFGAFGVLAVVLGALLGASVITTLMRAQIRQLGTMKALGATTRQVASLYAGAVLALAGAAATLGMPLGTLAGVAYARFVAGILNFDLSSQAVPIWVFGLELVAGLVVPLLAAAVPLAYTSQVTVRQAMTDHGLSQAPSELAVGWRYGARHFKRPMLLSLRNTFRRRGRLALTIGILAVGGATFMSALNVADSWQKTVDRLFDARRYDLQVVLTAPTAEEPLRQLLDAVPGVRSLETWATVWAVKRGANGSDEGYRLLVTGVSPTTAMVRYPLLEGRWLAPGDTDAMVINHELRQDQAAHVKLGDRVTLQIGQRPASFRVVGVVRELGVRRRGQNVPASAYVNKPALELATGLTGQASSVVLSAERADASALRALTQRIEDALDGAHIERAFVQPRTDRRKELLDHLLVIRNFLVVAAGFVAIIGGLALASAMSVNVLERTREIGAMRAIGASTGAVIRIFAAEGVLIAALSWAVALALSVPTSLGIGNYAGRIFVHSNLDNGISVTGVVIWLLLALLIGLLASVLPSLDASRGAVARALRYE